MALLKARNWDCYYELADTKERFDFAPISSKDTINTIVFKKDSLFEYRNGKVVDKGSWKVDSCATSFSAVTDVSGGFRIPFAIEKLSYNKITSTFFAPVNGEVKNIRLVMYK